MSLSPTRSRSSTAAASRRQTLQAAGARLRVELVLTAHPTEATRRTVLEAHRRVAALLAGLDDEAAPLSERRRLEDRLAEEITLLWQTDEIRSKRPRVVDEIRQGLWFFEQSFWNAIPELERALVERLQGAGEALRFGSWIGGDLDGNPNVGPETIADALERARQLARDLYRAELRELGAAWGMSTTVIGRVPEVGDADEPFRAVLVAIWERLGADALSGRRRAGRGSRRSRRACSARTAANGSPTAALPTSVRARARSASISPSSTFASTPRRFRRRTTASARRWPPPRVHRRDTEHMPSTA